jgi:hypothetical protein
MTGQVSLYNIYYGNFSSSESTRMKYLVDFFAQNLGGSSWYNIMTAYYQVINGVTTYASNDLRFGGSISIAVSSRKGSLSDSDVRAAISNAISGKTLPLDSNAVYTFIFRGDINFDGWVGFGGQSPRWCGYHSTFNYNKTGVVIHYSVIGDSGTARIAGFGGCSGLGLHLTANKNFGADCTASIFAHEVVEAVSNDFSAWNDHNATSATNGFENADMCAWQFGKLLPLSINANVVVGGKKWLLQTNWLPGIGCRQQYP